MSYHLHHSPYGSRGCDHSSCLDYDDDYNSTPYKKPEPRPKPVPPKRRETPSFGDVMSSLGTMIVGGVLILLAMGIPGYLLFSVIFGGGCSMQGGTC
jgi:hypothetical protein